MKEILRGNRRIHKNLLLKMLQFFSVLYFEVKIRIKILYYNGYTIEIHFTTTIPPAISDIANFYFNLNSTVVEHRGTTKNSKAK